MRLLHRAGLVLGLVALAACKESIAPKSLSNPQQTTAQMNAFDTLFANNVLNSFTAISGDIAPVAPASVSAWRQLAGAANPLNQSSALRPYAKGLETSRMLRRLVPTMTSAATADIFPPDIDGKTFEYDTAANMYVQTARAGAPATGVRFILYAVDPFTEMPVEPTVEIGYVDLADESTVSVGKLHVIAAGSGVTFVNYTVSLEALTSSSARITTAGYITNGATSPDSLRFTGVVTASGNASSVQVTQDVSFDVNSHDAHVRLWERVTFTSTTASLRIFFSFKHGVELVTLDGSFDLDQIGETVDGNITVKVDGGLFATCTVAASASSYNLTCEGADADGLNAAEVEALDQIGDALAKIENTFAGVLNPGINILGGGI